MSIKQSKEAEQYFRTFVSDGIRPINYGYVPEYLHLIEGVLSTKPRKLNRIRKNLQELESKCTNPTLFLQTSQLIRQLNERALRK